jgi:hypothetical protein
MAQDRACKHCVGWFSPTRKQHFYCSDTCRKLAHKARKAKANRAKLAKRLETKLTALSASVFGRYLHKEIVRAGTVQILAGHTSESLALLAALRRRCTAEGGYKKGLPMGAFELGHIYPVKGNGRVGLLHPSNLVICPKEFNRKHSKSLPVEGYMGLSLPSSELEEKWLINGGMTAHEVLKLCRKFIGVEFDNWLKSHQISVSQQSQLIKKLEAEGLPRSQLLSLRLEELKALADEEEVPYFAMDKDPAEDWYVIHNEYLRLLPAGPLEFTLRSIDEIEFSFFSMNASVEFLGDQAEYEAFKIFITKQALKQLHGQPFECTWKSQTLDSYLKVKERRSYAGTFPQPTYDDDDDDDIL